MAQVINDDLGPDIVLPPIEEEAKKVSSRRDAPKQAAGARDLTDGYALRRIDAEAGPVLLVYAPDNRNLAHGAYRGHVAEKDVLIFERDGHLLCAINQSAFWVGRWAATPWKGQRLHDHSGRAGDLFTGANGWGEVWIPPQSFAMYAPG